MLFCSFAILKCLLKVLVLLNLCCYVSFFLVLYFTSKSHWLVNVVVLKTARHEWLQEAAKTVQPSSRREGFSAIPNVKWEDVGGLHVLRQEFDRYIVRRIKFPEDYEVTMP